MQTQEMVNKISGYFGRSYTDEQLRQLERVIDSIGESSRDTVLNYLYEHNEATHVLSVKNIVEACIGLGVAYKQVKIQGCVEEVECAACGMKYRWRQWASDEDSYNSGIFCKCPRCGWAHQDTLVYEQYKAMGFPEESKATEMFLKHTRKCREDHATEGKKPVWSRSMYEQELKQAQRARVDRIMQEIRQETRVEQKSLGL